MQLYLHQGKCYKIWSIPKAFEEADNKPYQFNCMGEIKQFLSYNSVLLHARKERNSTHDDCKHPVLISFNYTFLINLYQYPFIIQSGQVNDILCSSRLVLKQTP